MGNKITPDKFVEKMNDLFIKFADTKNLNKQGSKIRNIKDGITNDACFLYRFLYTKIGNSKESCVCDVNASYNTNFLRNAYESKENNISLTVYHHMFDQIKHLYESYVPNPSLNSNKLCLVDGCNNTNKNMDILLNMGYFDADNGVPLDLTFNGKHNRNNEVKCSLSYIKKNLDVLKDKILVFDRGYFSFNFISYLIANKIQFIIRKKGKSSNVYNKFEKLRQVFIEHKFTKTVYKSKKSKVKKDVTIKDSYEFITNLDVKNFSDSKVFELYGKRWDIEIFFKFIKYNFKFQNLREKNINSCKKLYYCELILYYLKEIIKIFYFANRNVKINNSLLMENIYKRLLFDILSGTLTIKKLNNFCKVNIRKVNKNQKGRSNPRISKTPFSKWYVKGFSEYAKYIKILEAIKNKTIDKLNKNLKILAKKIIDINENDKKKKKNKLK